MKRATRAVAAASMALVVVAPAARAEEPVAAGWWYRLQSGLSPVAVPAPPDAPPDGLYVALDPSGPLAIAAVSYASTSADGGTLTLTFDSAPKGDPAIDACVATAAISGARAGSWETRPGYDCDAGRVEGSVAPDGSTIAFTLTSAFVSPAETVDAVLVPRGAAPFTAPIAKPGATSFAPAAAPATDGGGFTPDPGMPLGGETGTPLPADDFGSGEPLAPGGALGDPSLPPGPPAPGTGGATTGGPIDGGADTPVAAGPRAEDAATDRLPKTVAVVLLVALGAAYWVLSNRPEGPPRLIGGLTSRVAAPATSAVDDIVPIALTGAATGGAAGRGSQPVGGLGRFARPRDRLPNRLT